MAVKFDVYLFLFGFLSYPIWAFMWKVLSGLLAGTGIPGLNKTGQGLAGVV